MFLCFIAYLVFACFSYPCDDFTMFMLLAFILGGLSESIPSVVNVRAPYFKWVFYFLGGFVIIVLAKDFVRKVRIERALTGFMYRDEYKSFDYLQENFASFENSRELVFRYARTFYLKGEYEVGIPVLKQAIKLYPTTGKYCDLGEMYQSPYLIYPPYCLFLFYREMKRETEARQMAFQIKDLSPKVDNQAVRDIKFIVEKYLYKPSSQHEK